MSKTSNRFLTLAAAWSAFQGGNAFAQDAAAPPDAGCPPKVSIVAAPTVLDFMDGYLNVDSDPLTLSVKNNGQDIVLAAPTTTLPDVFAVDTANAMLRLRAGAVTTFDVYFHPLKTGPIDGQVMIRVAGCDAPAAVVIIKGTGAPAPQPVGLPGVPVHGCSCAIAQQPLPGIPGALLGIAVASLLWRRRRRKTLPVRR
jgi:MYXO-CTERM domain-containing protein